jgi:hypothetical protein
MGFPRSSAGCARAGRWLSIGRMSACGRLVARLALLLASTIWLSAAHPEQANRVIRARLEWKSEKPERWAGVLETSQGTIANAASLDASANEAGTLWADGKCLWLGRRNACSRDGFEVTVIAPPSAHLSFTLQSSAPDGVRQRFDCLVSDLEGECKCLSAKSAALRLSVQRAPGDALRIVVDRPNLIYRPGETFKATLIPDVLSEARLPAGARLKWWLSATRTGETLKKGVIVVGRKMVALRDGSRGLPVEIPLPTDEGPVSLCFRLVESGPSEPRSSVHLLMLADQAPRDEQAGPAADTLIDRLTPDDISSKRRLEPALSGLPAHSAAVIAPGVDAIEVPVPSEPRVDWIAVRLRLKHPQQPHRLVLQIASSGGDFLGASLLEPDARGELLKQTLDTGLALADGESSDEPSTPSGGSLRHEILFWPQVSDPVLLLHDLASGHRPSVAGIEVYEVARPAARHADSPLSQERLIGPYLAKPLLAENFGGPKVYDARAEHCVEDWETCHAAAKHVAEYLTHNGYNSLLIAALADGATIYPSAHVEPTRCYDSGAVAAGEPIPNRKDFLELLYRVFDREGLALIPELQFSCPLPALERQLVDGAAAEGIELVGSDGRTALELRNESQEVPPEYNPLDPRVQDAVLAALREVVQRYRHHPSFRGVSLEITRTGYLQLPGLDWGYDSATVRRFTHDTGVAVDTGAAGDVYQRRHEVLCGEARAAWIRWRCQEMAKFYRRLAETMAPAGPNARLILACKQMLFDPGTDEEVRREIRTRGRLAELLAARGVDFSLLGDAPHLVVLKSAVWRAAASVEERLLDEALGQVSSFGAAFHFPSVGMLNFRPPRTLRVAEFDELSPWQPAQTKLIVAASPSARESRRRFVRGLAETDAQMIFDGGWTAPLGQEYATEGLRRIARAIPPIPFYKVEGDQSAVVHIARRNKKTYLYAVNAFAQSCELTLDLSCPPGTACRPLGPSPALIEIASGDEPGSRAKTSLEGYGLAAWEIEHEDARVTAVHTQLPPAELARLQARVGRFQRQLAIARKSAQTEQSVAATAAAQHSAKGEAIPVSRESQPDPSPLLLTSGRGVGNSSLADASPEAEPLSPDDLRQLAKISLQLALAADEKQIAECQSLLDSYWCRYLSLRSESASQPALFREAAKPAAPATR